MLSFICPRCEAPLAPPEGASELRCGACRTRFPALDGIPVLFADPTAKVREWREGLELFARETNAALSHVLVERLEVTLSERTRERLDLVASALPAHRDAILGLFLAAGVPPAGHEPRSDAFDILAYYSLLHRDWAWAPDNDEVIPAVDALVAVLPEGFSLGRTLVLGAGTGRLAWELGNRIPGAQELFALDINPLPLLATRQLMAGNSLELWELPGHPRRSSLAAKCHTLRPYTPPPPGLQLVLADGLVPPFTPGSFDTVLTPWFVDQVPEDLASIPSLVRRLLRPGGTWLNQGPFVYDPARTRPAHRYCADEFVRLVAEGGFKVSKATYEPTPYMASPLSAQGRTEWVLTLHATATDTVPLPIRDEPRWLQEDGEDVPVPALPGSAGSQDQPPVLHALAQLLDGKRSRATLRALLVEQGAIVDDDTADAVVRACLRLLKGAPRA